MGSGSADSNSTTDAVTQSEVQGSAGFVIVIAIVHGHAADDTAGCCQDLQHWTDQPENQCLPYHCELQHIAGFAGHNKEI